MWKTTIMVVSFLLALSISNLLMAQDKISETKHKDAPALQISCFDTEDPVAVEGKTTYVLEVKNAGTSPATNIQFNILVSEKLKFLSAQGPKGTRLKTEGNVLTFSNCPRLKPGTMFTYRIGCKAIAEGSAEFKTTLTYDQSQKPLTDIEGTSCY